MSRQLQRFSALGKREAMAYIREDYARFAGLCFRRLLYYWSGLPHPQSRFAPFANLLFVASSVLAFWGLGRALQKHRPRAWLFCWLMAAYPLAYYAVFFLPRYRHPIEPELGILMVYIISEAESWRRSVTS